MDLTTYIRPELLGLIPVLVVFGAFLKSSEKFKSNMIPITLGGAGVILSILWTLGNNSAEHMNTAMMIFTSIVEGFLCAGAAVYGHQIWKQNIVKE